jgi:hypothetical protein
LMYVVQVGGESKVGQYFGVVQGFNSQSATSEAAAEAIKMKADNVAPACLAACEDDFPLFSTSARQAAFDCHYFQVEWWQDPNGTKAVECMQAKCTQEEQAKFRRAFRCNCDQGGCTFDEPYQAIASESQLN